MNARSVLTALLLTLAATVHGAEPPLRSLQYGDYQGNYVVPSLGVIEGVSPGVTVIHPEQPRAVIESENFTALAAAGTAQWRNQGACVQPALRNFTIDCRGGFSTDRLDTAAAYKDAPLLYDGVRLFASGATVEHVAIVNTPGTALLMVRGTSPRSGLRDLQDAEEAHVANVRIIAALGNGWEIAGAHSDGTSNSVSIGGIRGDGFVSGASVGGWTHTALHVYCADRGIVEHGTNTYIATQGESCRIGLMSDGDGATFLGHKSFNNREVGVLLVKRTRLEAANLQALEGVALNVASTAHGCYVQGDMMLGAKADGAVVNGDKTSLNLKCWGGKTQCIIGSERPVSACTINIECDGCECGVDIRQLGTGNTINVRVHGKRVKSPLVGKYGGSNVVTVTNVD